MHGYTGPVARTTADVSTKASEFDALLTSPDRIHTEPELPVPTGAARELLDQVVIETFHLIGEHIASADARLLDARDRATEACVKAHAEGEHDLEPGFYAQAHAYHQAHIAIGVEWLLAQGVPEIQVTRWATAEANGVDVSDVHTIINEDGVTTFDDEEGV